MAANPSDKKFVNNMINDNGIKSRSFSPSPSIRNSNSEDSDEKEFYDSRIISLNKNELSRVKPVNFPQDSKRNQEKEKLDQLITSEINVNKAKETVVFKVTIEDLLNKNPFQSIKTVAFNLSLAAMSISVLILFYSVFNAFRDWIFNKSSYLTRDENWVLFIHSVIIILTQLVLRWDIYYCSIDREKDRNLTFHFTSFAVLLFAEFLFITRILFVLYPKRGLTFWTYLLLMLCMIRFVIQIFILTAIKIAKRELDDKKIKLAILKEKQKFEQQQNINSIS